MASRPQCSTTLCSIFIAPIFKGYGSVAIIVETKWIIWSGFNTMAIVAAHFSAFQCTCVTRLLQWVQHRPTRRANETKLNLYWLVICRHYRSKNPPFAHRICRRKWLWAPAAHCTTRSILSIRCTWAYRSMSEALLLVPLCHHWTNCPIKFSALSWNRPRDREIRQID